MNETPHKLSLQVYSVKCIGQCLYVSINTVLWMFQCTPRKNTNMNSWTHFSSWRLWFTCKAPATAWAPSSEIWLDPRLQECQRTQERFQKSPWTCGCVHSWIMITKKLSVHTCLTMSPFWLLIFVYCLLSIHTVVSPTECSREFYFYADITTVASWSWKLVKHSLWVGALFLLAHTLCGKVILCGVWPWTVGCATGKRFGPQCPAVWFNPEFVVNHFFLCIVT